MTLGVYLSRRSGSACDSDQLSRGPPHTTTVFVFKKIHIFFNFLSVCGYTHTRYEVVITDLWTEKWICTSVVYTIFTSLGIICLWMVCEPDFWRHKVLWKSAVLVVIFWHHSLGWLCLRHVKVRRITWIKVWIGVRPPGRDVKKARFSISACSATSPHLIQFDPHADSFISSSHRTRIQTVQSQWIKPNLSLASHEMFQCR